MRGKAKTNLSPGLPWPFRLGCSQNTLFPFVVDLSTSAKVIKAIYQVTIPIQVTLICGRLTLKASLNARHVSADVIRKQMKTSVLAKGRLEFFKESKILAFLMQSARWCRPLETLTGTGDLICQRWESGGMRNPERRAQRRPSKWMRVKKLTEN